YEDDVLMYGRGRNNVVHIGDWLIDQFPLTRAIDDEPLVISNEPGHEIALDRAMRTIQQHKQVYSTVPPALLCALTSAELAAYAEMPERQPHLATGQFRSMLIDVFGPIRRRSSSWSTGMPSCVTRRAFMTTWPKSAPASVRSCAMWQRRRRPDALTSMFILML